MTRGPRGERRRELRAAPGGRPPPRRRSARRLRGAGPGVRRGGPPGAAMGPCRTRRTRAARRGQTPLGHGTRVCPGSSRRAAGRPRDAPRQGPVPRRRDHEGRPRRLPRGRGAGDAAARPRPPARLHRFNDGVAGEGFFQKEIPRGAGLGAPRPRAQAGRDRLPPAGPGRGDAGLAGQPELHHAAYLDERAPTASTARTASSSTSTRPRRGGLRARAPHGRASCGALLRERGASRSR